MNRDGFLLGFFATGGQVLLLRGLVASFGGSELLIGAVLFGWLIFVALGAWVGGHRSLAVIPTRLFVAGVLLLQISLAATKLAPIIVTDVTGEAIPFSTAFGMSILLVAPVAFISGWLFPVIARKGGDSADSVASVYLFEGLGAFVSGLTIVLTIGSLLSNSGTGFITGAIVLIGISLPVDKSRLTAAFLGLALLLLALLTAGGNSLDEALDSLRHPDYNIENSLDTHYGHQAILSREGDLLLLTDNAVEAVYPNLEADENLLVPPLVYRPNAREVLFIGRPELGVGQLATMFPEINFTAVDPRSTLAVELERHVGDTGPLNLVADDPVAYLSESATIRLFDIIIVNPGSFDSYRNSRLVTAEFLNLAKACLRRDGLFFMPTDMDTDRYVTGEVRELLSILYRTLSDSFAHVNAWPGHRTLFLASDSPPVALPYDTVLTRLSQLPYRAAYICEDYLSDRLSEFKSERLRRAITQGDSSNRLSKPLLATIQAWYRSKASSIDRGILMWVIRKPAWLLLIPLTMLVFFWRTMAGPRRRNRYALYLYFVAGLVSLSLELTAFYIYQSAVGTLYSEIAILIGTFMLGLALGAYAATRTTRPGVDRLALVTLLAATVLYGLTWDATAHWLSLVYHLLFLLVVALATGSLFVAATRLYYVGTTDRNRGSGYAWELAGSAMGALLTTTVLLPVIGLNWLLISIALLLLTACIACVRDTGRD